MTNREFAAQGCNAAKHRPFVLHRAALRVSEPIRHHDKDFKNNHNCP